MHDRRRFIIATCGVARETGKKGLSRFQTRGREEKEPPAAGFLPPSQAEMGKGEKKDEIVSCPPWEREATLTSIPILTLWGGRG